MVLTTLKSNRMEWNQINIKKYTEALSNLNVYYELYIKVISDEPVLSKKHAYQVIEKRIHEVTGYYRFKNYQSFISSLYHYKIK